LGLEVDHIIAESTAARPSPTTWRRRVFIAHRAKGSDIGSIDWDDGAFVRFYPAYGPLGRPLRFGRRPHRGRTPIGSVTVRILEFNAAPRLFARKRCKTVARYPNPAALRRIAG